MEYDGSQIRVVPQPLSESLPNGRRRQVWVCKLIAPVPDSSILDRAAQILSNDRCDVAISQTRPSEITVVVTTMPTAGVVDIYGLAIQPALQHLIGEMDTISGRPRDEWPPFSRPDIFQVDWGALGMVNPFSQ